MPKASTPIRATLQLTLVYASAPRRWLEVALVLPAGSTVGDAIRCCTDTALHQALLADEELISLGVWGRKCSPSQVLRDGDRIECYRPLQVDPKVARRERFKAQGARTAGLFATRRAHSKAGY